MEEREKKRAEGKDEEKGELAEIARRNEKARGEERKLENNMQKRVKKIEKHRRAEARESGRYPWEMYGLYGLAIGLLTGLRMEGTLVYGVSRSQGSLPRASR